MSTTAAMEIQAIKAIMIRGINSACSRFTKYRLSKEIDVPAQRIGEIVAGRRAITADTDLRLCKYFGLSTGYWLRVQNKYDTEIVRRKIADQLDSITPLNRAI